MPICRYLLIALLALGCLPLANAQAQALSPQEVFRRVSPSVVLIKVYGRDDQLRALGSGVVVARQVVASNCHVLRGKGSHYAVIHWQDKEIEVDGDNILGQDKERDLCTLNAPGLLAPVATMGHSRDVDIGSSVYAVGAPEGFELSLSAGLVSGFREYDGNQYIQTTAPISKGSSGGGLFDAQGRLVGITTMYLKDAQALNFAVPAELIASIPAVELKVQRAARGPESVPQRRDRWWTVYEDDEREVAFDTETISREGVNVTVWVRWEYTKPQHPPSGKIFVEDVSRYTFYCGSRQISYNQFTWRDASGQVVYNSGKLKNWEIERKDVMPETIYEFMYKAACDD